MRNATSRRTRALAGERRSLWRPAAAVSAGVAVAFGCLAGPGAGPAAAANADPVTLQYHCVYPLIGSQQLTVKITTSLPDTISVGKSTGAVTVQTVSTVSAGTTPALYQIGSATLEGSADAAVKLNLPDGSSLPITAPNTLTKTNVPQSGPFDINATGSITPLTFSQPGKVTASVGDLRLNVTPRDAQGNLTGLGSFEADCTQDPGQNPVVATVNVTAADTQPPTAPGNVHTTAVSTTGVSLAWDASTDNVGVTGYQVYQGTTKVADVTGTSADVTGLTPGTGYTFTVKAEDAAGNLSPASAPLTVTTKPTSYTYTLKGSSALKASGGTIQLTGAAAMTVGTSGNVTGTFSLDPATYSFNLLGFLPATAAVNFQQDGTSSGTLTGAGALTVDSHVFVRVPSVTVFGLPVAGGTSCQSATSADVVLKSAAAFDPAAGGSLQGTYDLPAWSGCGALDTISAIFGPSTGNTATIALAPKGT
jgi:chitodextrinase